MISNVHSVRKSSSFGSANVPTCRCDRAWAQRIGGAWKSTGRHQRTGPMGPRSPKVPITSHRSHRSHILCQVVMSSQLPAVLIHISTGEPYLCTQLLFEGTQGRSSVVGPVTPGASGQAILATWTSCEWANPHGQSIHTYLPTYLRTYVRPYVHACMQYIHYIH